MTKLDDLVAIRLVVLNEAVTADSIMMTIQYMKDLVKRFTNNSSK